MVAQDAFNELVGGAWMVAPTPSIIYHMSGASAAINTSGRRLFGYRLEDLPSIQEHYNLFKDETLIELNLLDLIRSGFQNRVMIPPFNYWIIDHLARRTDRSLMVQIDLAPVRYKGEIGTYVAAFYTDVSQQLELRQEVEQQQITLQQAESLQLKLREEIEARSAPVVPIFAGVLVLPLIGAIDSMRAQQVIQSVLEQATQHQANTLILDITGVPVVDTAVANYLLQAIRALKLVGTETVLVGISPEIAQTIVQLGIRLEDITTRADLQSGLQYALHQQGLTITPQRR